MANETLRNAPLLTAAELTQRLGEFYESLEQFNGGYWFESHETLEDLWQVAPLPDRTLFQGIIQTAAALVHFARGEYPGILKLFDQALEKLRPSAPERLGVDVEALVADIERARDELQALGEDRFREWDESHAPRVPFEVAA